MPSHGKQEAKDHYSEAYQALLLERESLLQQRSELLSKQKFNQLNETQQLQYCGLNKKLMENYWRGYEKAKADEKFQSSAKDFQQALEMSHSKARALFLEKKTNAQLKNKTSFSSSSDHNLINGLRLHLGLGCPQNQEEAVLFYTQAAKQKHASARYNLGFCYRHGIGVDKDKKKSFKWFRLAAKQGHAGAQNNLGFCYRHSIGVDNDENEAFKWFRLAAKQGYAGAQTNLGLCYQKGTVIDKDEIEAVKWYRLAAEQGLAVAQNNLGLCYQKGTGVDKDEIEAVKWYRLAAEQGYASALNNLKHLDTLLARYTVALLEKNHARLIEEALSDKDLSEVFFEKDIFYAIQQLDDKVRISIFLQTLLEKTQGLDKNKNVSLTALLLSVEKAIGEGLIEGDEENVAFMTDLLDKIEPGDTERGQIKPLMHFFCNLDDKENAKETLDALCKLWHRAQSFNVFQMDDSGLNRLIATRIASQLFDNRYALAFTADFSENKLNTLVTAYDPALPFTVKEPNDGLGESLLIESKYHPKNLLPTLKAYLPNRYNFDGETLHYIEKINRVLQAANPDNETEWQPLFDDLKGYANGILVKQKQPSFFNSKKTLCAEERTLLEALGAGDTKGVQEWMDTHASDHQEAASASASLG